MKGDEQRYCIILVETEDERKERELQVEAEDGIKTENDEDNVLLGILIGWKGSKGRGNPRKNSVKNPPMSRVKNPGVEDGRKSAKHKQ
jgi:hypothetical protein